MSRNRSFLVLLLAFLLLAISSAAARLSNPSSLGAFPSRNHHNHHHHLYYKMGQSHYCGSFPDKTSQYFCIQFQRVNQQRQQRFRVIRVRTPPAAGALLSPPGDNDDHQIDPRYGVEKRLVPSGPNPLHN